MTSPRKSLVAAAVLTLCAAASAVNGQPPARSDHELMQGTWVCTQTLKDGENVRTWVGVKAVIEGDNLTWHYPNADGTFRTDKCKFRIDAGKKHFDWWRPAKPESIDSRIYSVGGNEMRMTTQLDFKTRPASLDKGRWQFTCRRVDPGR